ncbi:ATP-binding protein [Mesorhizobium sp. M7A.F.Ca.CA.001.12.2.1]|uniref:ATP-binding protein n=1 Tax=unclassified Mesorhizobium TaxID=325217 RepID=UPI000FCA5912|nr:MULTISPECIES: ATP-binding protein [unclassified Mesorhizobium]RUY95959.1 ATP-binding protein [Mesorhizobium sp. M7A.F.Ca.CA.001.12.2.1]RUZ29384.1 ATP-binding protein [Mesorhizobium sp. M7A.F.Ca.US.007.01.2.1]RUZ41721.1 ATP-binding protein [Mesorhizobium sp. M7A.F.Ca.US.003.02.1.1]RUZ69705.1 ATP-binding protein [Mesorhizobium sp. M7A.F.Ca.US.007.01.1.1]
MKPSGLSDATVIGAVQDVSGTSVSATLRADRFSGLSFVGGQGYRIGQIGSFVKIPVGYVDLFGIVSQVGASAVPESLAKAMPNGQRWITVQLVGEGYRSGKFQRGISQYPTIDDEVHLVSEADLHSIYGSSGRQNHFVRIGHIAGSESIDALVDINKLITRHSAIVGTTGSGKSTTVAGILNVLSNTERFPSARIVVLDLHGEYSQALGDRANVFKVNPDERRDTERKLCIPFWALSFDELLRVTFGPLPADGKARNIILERVIEAKAHSLKANPIDGVTTETVSADSPVPFSLNKLWHQLYCTEFGTYYSNKGSAADPANWAYEIDVSGKPLLGDAEAGIPPRFKKIKNVKEDPEKINYIPDGLNLRGQLESLGSKLRVSRYDFLLRAGDWHPDLDGKIVSGLADLMKDWVGSPNPVTILDLSGVPSQMTNDIIGNVLRVLYDGLFWARNQSEGGRERPLLVVMEEAHAYLNDKFESAASIVTQRIVKEGRKYGIGAMIVSQRPSEINPTILSQCGTFFAMRLSNASDRSHVTGVLPDNLEGLTNMLPILRTGEAIILGEAVGLPMRTMIQAPPKDRRPDSQDPVVCDELPPEESTTPGGWNISKVKHPDYGSFVETWLAQNPILSTKPNTSGE